MTNNIRKRRRIKVAKHPATILREMADLSEEKEQEYGTAYLRHGNIMKALFPNGIDLYTAEDFNKFALLDLVVVKLNRTATQWGKALHVDSLLDMGVYASMLLASDSLIESAEDPEEDAE